jgi:hypothetical protein
LVWSGLQNCSFINATLTWLNGQCCDPSLHAPYPLFGSALSIQVSTNMPMTRHSARSSFTFEIKRANRPSPEILGRRKTSFPASLSLADQVFSKFSGLPTTPQSPRFEVPPSDRLPSQSGSLGTNSREMREGTEPTSKPTPRRVLPDLLSSPSDPVEERLRAEAEERAARRRTVRRMRADEGHGTSPEPIHDHNIAPKGDALADSTNAFLEAETADAGALAAPEKPNLQQSRRRSHGRGEPPNLKAAARRAQTKGLAEPRLPAGSRWKRRLNWTCW